MIMTGEYITVDSADFNWQLEEDDDGLKIKTTGGWYVIKSNIRGELQLNEIEKVK